MKNILKALVIITIFVAVLSSIAFAYRAKIESEAEFQVLGQQKEILDDEFFKPDAVWERPNGPLRVGLQAGHWKNNELPDELENLRNNGGGAKGGGVAEWEVNLAIARQTKELLEQKGIVVDILPATIPPDYWADVFIAIHADGSDDARVSGFKAAAPWRDMTRKSQQLVSELEKQYAATTGMKIDPNITRNMRGYYAFNWRRYEHSIDPMSTAAILETGFLTNYADQKILIKDPSKAASGIAQAVFNFLNLNP